MRWAAITGAGRPAPRPVGTPWRLIGYPAGSLLPTGWRPRPEALPVPAPSPVVPAGYPIGYPARRLWYLIRYPLATFRP
jgi:hypothetical protein